MNDIMQDGSTYNAPPLLGPAVETAMQDNPKNKPGRPKGFDGTRSRMPSAMAQRFRQCGLDWQADFAEAIKLASRSTTNPSERRWAKERIKLWLKLLPYMITTGKKAKVKRWKGRASKAAIVALEAMEQEL